VDDALFDLIDYYTPFLIDVNQSPKNKNKKGTKWSLFEA